MVLSWQMAGYAVLGAAVRIVFGLYKAYEAQGYLRLDWKRILIEFCSALVFGTFSAVLLADMGTLKYAGKLIGPYGIALFGGFAGSDLVNRVAKSIGAKQLDIKVAGVSGVNMRQQQALTYVTRRGSITNDEYQVLVKTSNQTAKRDLALLVRKGMLKRSGIKKGTKYTF